MSKIEYTAKVDALLAHAHDFTEQDFTDLAVAAADQAGLSATEQAVLRALLAPKCSDCGGPIDNYGAIERDEVMSPSAGLCEDCHAINVRVAKRDRAERIREGRGDYLRDQRKDGF